MTNKLENLTSLEESIEFQKDTLYVFLSSTDNKELTPRKIGLIINEEINQTQMDSIAEGCTMVEKKNEVGSLYPYLDVLICPSGAAVAVNKRKLDYVNVYLEDILLANESYHKKSIIQFISVDEKSVITSEGKEDLKDLLSQMIINNKNQVTKEIKL